MNIIYVITPHQEEAIGKIKLSREVVVVECKELNLKRFMDEKEEKEEESLSFQRPRQFLSGVCALKRFLTFFSSPNFFFLHVQQQK